MNFNDLIATALSGINEILSTGIVIIATSLLLYNLTRNLNNRVARTSGAVLASVTFAYIVDVYLSLGPNNTTALVATRLQWFGLAFIPSTLFHLSDALLATTGLPSRGRRKATVRILYLISFLFFLSAIFTDWLTIPVLTGNGILLDAKLASLFPVYGLFFMVICGATFVNLNRARQRCLTAGSKRRMAYLQFAILTPALGIFPYSALLPPSDNISLLIPLFVNIANIIVIIMLVFLSYPLSFFGSDVPDRVVKVELLRFLLRGPGTALVALGVIVAVGRTPDILNLSASAFLPFGVIASVLFWQWMIHLALPYLEKWLIYRDEDDDQLSKLQGLSDKLLTQSDFKQLLGATLEAMCDYLQTDLAFVISLKNGESDLVYSTRESTFLDINWSDKALELRELADNADRVTHRSQFQKWQDWYFVPLYSTRVTNEENNIVLIGMLGVQTPDTPTAIVDEQDTNLLYNTYVARAEQTLDDMMLQDEIYAALEGLLPQLTTTRRRDDLVTYRPNREAEQVAHLPDDKELYEQVRAALRHYWGGPGITRSRLLELKVAQEALQDAESSLQALHNLIQMAMERLRPESERSLTATEWTLYNIIDLRFIEGKKVRDVARRMSLSEPDLYRKQRLAIEEMAQIILTMEQEITISNNPL
ncbi:MAG: histidine kinase N-terminal 7TM domain-containing protein [Phototrophicaceae bacterium]